MIKNEKCLLLILDGWGTAKKDEINGSAIDNAGPLYFYELKNKYPHASLVTFGEEVGLPNGQMGNSEVGHLNIGAGRIVYQELQRINVAITSGELKNHPELHRTFQYCLENNKKLHLIGLYSDGGVHSHSSHFKAVIEYAEEKNLSRVLVHAFTDGRDCDPKSGKSYLENLEEFLSNKKTKLASICGRYYAMDRDKRWERVQLAYELLVHGKGEETNNTIETIENRYAAGETDEFIKPIKTKDFQAIEDGDAVICINFRTDRCREITQVLTQKALEEYDMKPLDLHYTTMTEYSKEFEKVHVIFRNDNLINTLGEVLAKNNRTQLRMAETEKYPHVTFFFSGGRENPFAGETRILVPSPKVATYDLQPEMSAYEIKDKLLVELKNTQPDFIVVNFANTDMVGHTGVFKAAVKATQAVDSCLKEIVPLALEKNYHILIIADHGNSDYMLNPDGSPNTAHSMNLVPIIYISNSPENIKSGKLGDVAPTILKLMGINKPVEMEGRELI
ncbi:MAG: 2,3-bisphosphoglycerate-independent phosphoglycerate mutase [Chitinophagales bacterium]|jgi:2,3-bisphosphoglycerate-independent phosphoglycerate mutase|nr:2,3-bisphosphoglycerate-independent phosphoglycerate mutase [Sphingobacteriales bacterium]